MVSDSSGDLHKDKQVTIFGMGNNPEISLTLRMWWRLTFLQPRPTVFPEVYSTSLTEIGSQSMS